MNRWKDFQQLAEQLSAAVPDQLKAARADFDQNLRPLIDRGLENLDLVTREEFDVQKAVLARTRRKLEDLDARLKAFEESQ